jgi:dienelactone hydrolase
MEADLPSTNAVEIRTNGEAITADVTVPPESRGVVVFAHGSGSGRFSPRNRAVARAFERAGLATVLADLLTRSEAAEDERTARHRFDIALLSRRVVRVLEWADTQILLRPLPVFLFGASTGAAAALVAAAERPWRVRAVVSRGGRPDLAGAALDRVRAPVLLIVGGRDVDVLRLNRQALSALHSEARIEVVAGATHLFEEPGALDEVTSIATRWMLAHIQPDTATRDVSR